MANITKRGESYLIRVSCGYDANDKKITRSMTWKPDPKLTPKQIEKELNRQAMIFEEKCKHGLVSLILSSKLPKAKEFKHWVTSEVLPSIRKYGVYMTDDVLHSV